jgi:hypothetical protein
MSHDTDLELARQSLDMLGYVSSLTIPHHYLSTGLYLCYTETRISAKMRRIARLCS